MNSTSVHQPSGVVYLLHCSTPLGNPDSPYGQAQHDCGWTDDLRRWVAEHRNGWGAAITRAAVTRGLDLALVAIWPGPRGLERQITRKKNARTRCPICQQLGDPPATAPFNDREGALLRQVPPKAYAITGEEFRAVRTRTVRLRPIAEIAGTAAIPL